MTRKLVGFFSVLAALATVPAALWFSTTERHVEKAAATLMPVLKPDDLVVIDGNLARTPDPGGLIRPFAPFAAVVMKPDEAPIDIPTFPQERIFFVGDAWSVQGQKLAGGVTLVENAHAGVPIVTLIDAMHVSVEQGGNVRGCAQRHPSGGVRCGNQPWQYMGPSVVVANGKKVACLWAHPMQQHRMHVEIPVEAAGRAQLWLQFGDEALNDKPHPPMVMNAFVEGNLVESVQCMNEKPGRCALNVDVKPPALRVTLETADAARQVACLGGEVVVNHE